MARADHFAKGGPALLNWTLPALFAVIAIRFAWLQYDGSYGLNLADEGLYLNVIANSFPYAVNIPPFLFGFLSHWPYQWAGNDIAVLRAANVTPTMALGWICSLLVIRRLWMAGWPHPAGLTAGLSSPALCNLGNWVLIPRLLRTQLSIALDGDDRFAASRAAASHPPALGVDPVGVDPDRHWRLVPSWPNRRTPRPSQSSFMFHAVASAESRCCATFPSPPDEALFASMIRWLTLHGPSPTDLSARCSKHPLLDVDFYGLDL
ncbi:hypothetical protein H8A95_21280 [Bradyrhizobium sp. Pear76]|uniref:hypothetical protein n=1 Tax=Bradyrhizobium oropedii TaxID=1571201 RepID=UPI001E3DF1A7|nr:hypothetical protein [Bradyrhizobium oropedii]MCC8964781.1 hypothetical protein [Bradyrhizobium oropedii]